MSELSAVKIPVFNMADPHLWFHMVEATFELATPKAITESRTKYNYTVAHLPPEVAAIVRDVIVNPDATDPFQKLKDEIIARCGETKTQEIRRLLNAEQLGDRKPTELLRIMQRRAESHSISDSLLLELFLKQLPPNVQSILASIPSVTPVKAAEVADRIMEVTNNDIAQVLSSSQSESKSADSELLLEIRALRKEVAALRRSRSTSRNRQHFRFRPRKDSASSFRMNNNSDICFYHQKFKSKAKKCSPPCSYKGNEKGQE